MMAGGVGRGRQEIRWKVGAAGVRHTAHLFTLVTLQTPNSIHALELEGGQTEQSGGAAALAGPSSGAQLAAPTSAFLCQPAVLSP